MIDLYMPVAFGSAFLLVGAIGVLLWARRAAYSRHLRYSPSVDYDYRLRGDRGREVSITWGHCGFHCSSSIGPAGAAFLELRVIATWGGMLLDPYIEVTMAGKKTRQYFERGVNGIRYLNLSRLLRNCLPSDFVRLRGSWCRWHPAATVITAFEDRLSADKPVVVLSPHPDDAEIAAFAVYSDTPSVVVTVTAGDGSDRYRDFAALTPNAVASIRSWESITIPQMGGVPPGRAVNLGYPDGCLEIMAEHPDADFRGQLDFDRLRKLNLSDLLRESRTCSWRSLVEDLAHVFRLRRPSIVVTPSPTYDSHLDHRFTTFAACEALRLSGLTDGRLFLPVIHNRGTELYPFGPASSEVGLPPVFDADDSDWEGIYCHELSADRQCMKYLALEAMHDLRDIPQVESTLKSAVRKVVREIKAILHGMGTPPTTYLRRGPRPEELFFVISYRRALELLPRWRSQGDYLAT